MNAKRTLLVVAGALGLVVGVHPALGELITFEFAGEITGVVDAIGLFGGGVTVGSPFSGVYTFESTTPDSAPASTTYGVYEDAISSMSGTAGTVPFLGPSEGVQYIEVPDSATDSSYLVTAMVDISGEDLRFGIILAGGADSVFANDALPLSPPDLAVFDFVDFQISNGNEAAPVGVIGELRSLALIPEPGTLTILAIGALVAVRRPRGRSREPPAPCFALTRAGLMDE